MLVTAESSQPLSAGWELVSVVAEVVAFFFVTVDLYGEERLTILNARISSGLNSSLQRLRALLGPFDDDPRHEFGTLRGFAGRILGTAFYSVLLFIIPPAHLFPFSFPQLLLELLNVCVALITLGMIVTLMVDLLCFLPAFPLWLVSKLKFKGLLLTFGTCIFLFSKGILAVHLSRELHGRLHWPP
jgi:hypothetical protein